MRKKVYIPQIKIESVIDQRLNLQSNKRLLSQEFNLHIPTLSSVTRPSFLHQYKVWPEERKKLFLNTIGGEVNYDRTNFFINNLIEKVEKEVFQTSEDDK